MRNAVNHISDKLIGLAGALLCAMPMTAHAQTISNIATIQWDVGTTKVQQQSNRVDIAVERGTPPPSAATITTYQFERAPGAQSLAIPSTTCRSSSGDLPVVLDGAFAGTALSPASVSAAPQIRAGEPLVISVNSPDDNQNHGAVDTVTVKLTTPSDDVETLILSETGADTGIFVGMVRTSAIPPAAVAQNCILSVKPDEKLTVTGLRTGDGTVLATSAVDVLIDPYGVVFDSIDGKPVAGTRVTLIDAVTNLPAQVFGDDGVSAFPSTIVTGSPVRDASGNEYIFPDGDYRFPFAKPGTYRLKVEPPAPYTAPSGATPAELAGFTRPDGLPYTIVDGSYSRVFTLIDPAPVRIDIPVDRPGGALIVRKTASAPVAVPGDAVQYRVSVQNSDPTRATGAITVTDILPPEMRLRKETVRFDGNIISYSVSSDSRTLTVPLAPLAAGASGLITYLLEVRPDAQPGMAMNKASARDNRGTQSVIADAVVRIARDGVTDRMTIIGRITDGGCTVDPDSANGLAGVRVMLEDGSYAVTDIEGRYHFEGVIPGLHVVQIDPSTLPSGQVPADCAQIARTSGSAISRFIDGQGGSLLRADFRSVAGTNKDRLVGEIVRRVSPPTPQEASGAGRDWFADQMGGIKWLFPEVDHNPRTKAVRVAIRHDPSQTVSLFVNGKPVDALAFDGVKKSGDGFIAASVWRAVELERQDTVLTADVKDAAGKLIEHLTRTVHFSASPLHAELIREKSLLIADGVTRPVIALRLTDRDGKTIHQGLVGDFSVPTPYYPAVEADAQAAKGLSGLERAKPVWRVEGDDGIAYVELEPTTASGGLSITLPFRDGDVTRSQQIETWLTPGKRPWTIVGFATGTLGYKTLKGHAEGLGAAGEHWYSDARLALYAKGRIKGQWLMTLAYDSDKDKNDARFGGTIDPTAYYTVYADRSERRYDAASVRNLYIKLERPQFYALFGDYETAINEPELTRYSRAFNGVKAEYRGEHVSATAFAADTPYRHRREEIQGNGLSGPYALGARDILPNSERVVFETRDRLRSNKIVETKVLVRHIDYDIDYVAGTLRFRDPVLSRSSLLDPQFIVVDYEVDGIAQRVLNAGGRASWTNQKKTLKIGATAIHDESDTNRTNMGGVDVRYTPTTNTEVRAEIALSDSKATNGAPTTATGSSTAWLIEAEHHGRTLDVLAYAREQQAGFGVGQQNASEGGTRKFGLDGRVRVNNALSFVGSAWQEDSLAGLARRQAGRALAEYRTKALDMRAGLTVANDRLDDGTTATSTIAQLGGTKRFFNNKLEIDAQTEVPIGNRGGSIDFPARHRLSARVAVTSDVTLVGSYEIAKGKEINARTARVGFDVKPWAGARLTASANQQVTNEYGPRSYAAYGIAQSVPVNKKLSLDFTLDGNKVLGGVDSSKILNPNQPIASGGFLGTGGVVIENFTAVTAGATYRTDIWSVAGRAEYRNGDTADRYGLTLAALRQIGEGRAFGGSLTWFTADQLGGARTDAKTLALSWAHRPDDSRFAFLEKLELRSDSVRGAVFGNLGPIGGAPLTVSGDVSSKRVINSFSLNYSPTTKREDGSYLGRSEISAFWGTRYVFDKFGSDEIKGWSNVFGADIRFDLSKTLDLGVSGTLRQSPGGRAIAYAVGPAIGISPLNNTYISVGYNVVGFNDKDFSDSRYTRKGPFVTLRLKFDQNSLAGLGLGRR
jgi:uncharacterized repeat protein (TIGR01451 family)